MKLTLLLIICLFTVTANAQTVAELQKALNTPGMAVQAIHGYPASVYQGKCHWVPVTDIKVEGNHITITETWTGGFGLTTTVLTGTLSQGKVSGTWSSSFSSGNWGYVFAASAGQWNKPKSVQQAFDEYYFLKFRIVDRKNLKDGPNDCN